MWIVLGLQGRAANRDMCRDGDKDGDGVTARDGDKDGDGGYGQGHRWGCDYKKGTHI